jgi:steroid delta-isomerase-like uncharacterized protein
MIWFLVGSVFLVLFVILEGKRQERKYGRSGGKGGSLMRTGLLEFQRHLEPEKKVEIFVDKRETRFTVQSGDEPTKGGAMPESENATLARRWFTEVWNERSEAAVNELLAPDAAGHMEGGLEVRGPAEFHPVRAALLGAFPDMEVNVDQIISQGDDVVVRWSAKGTHRGEHLGFPASNRAAAFRGMTWLRFQDGKIVEGWDAWNQGRVMRELGAP